MNLAGNSSCAKLVNQSISINGLNEATTEFTVNLHGESNNFLGQVILRSHGENPILHSVNLVNLVIP